MELLEPIWAEFFRIIKAGYFYIFPEYPAIGVIIIGLALVFFLIYWIKSEFFHAAKIGLTVFIVLSVLMLLLHHLMKILHVGFRF